MKLLVKIIILISAGSSVIQCQSTADTEAQAQAKKVSDAVTALANSSSLGQLLASLATTIFVTLISIFQPIGEFLGGSTTISGPSTPENIYAGFIEVAQSVPVFGPVLYLFISILLSILDPTYTLLSVVLGLTQTLPSIISGLLNLSNISLSI